MKRISFYLVRVNDDLLSRTDRSQVIFARTCQSEKIPLAIQTKLISYFLFRRHEETMRLQLEVLLKIMQSFRKRKG